VAKWWQGLLVGGVSVPILARELKDVRLVVANAVKQLVPGRLFVIDAQTP